MSVIAYIDLLTILVTVFTAGVILFGKKPFYFLRAVHILLLILVSLNFFYSLILFLEWSGITSRLDWLEDYAGVFIPFTWAFVFYTFIKSFTEEDLRSSRERFRNLIESSSDWIWESDCSGVISYSSPQIKNMLDYLPHEILNRQIFDFMSEDEAQDLRRLFEQAMEHKQPVTQQPVYFETKGGSSKCIEISAALAYDKSSRLIGLRGVNRDVSRRKKDEFALALSERRFRLIANYTYDWEIWMSLTGMALWTNPAVERITGYTTQECSAMNNYPVCLVYEQDRQQVENIFKSAKQGSSGENEIFRIVRKDRQIRWVAMAWQSAYDARNNPHGFRVSIRDVHQRVIAQQELAHRKILLDELLANLPGMVYQCDNDKDWTMQFVSFGCEELTGYQSHELIGNGRVAYGDIIMPQDRDRVWNIVQKAIKQKKNFRMQYNIKTADGEIKKVWEQGMGVYDENGSLESIKGFITDIEQWVDYFQTHQDFE